MKLKSEIYDVLKWICIMFIPGLNTFLVTCLPVWGVNQVAQTIIFTTVPAVGTFLGSLLAVSTANYYKKEF